MLFFFLSVFISQEGNFCSLLFPLLGVAPNLPTIPSASDFNTVLSSDQNTLDGTHSQHSTSQDDEAGIEEANPGFPAVQLADAQVILSGSLLIITFQAVLNTGSANGAASRE